MKSEKEIAVEGLTAESIKRTLSHIKENGRLCFVAQFEAMEEDLPFTIDSKWQIHRVMLNDKEFSFIASMNGKAMKFDLTSHLRQRANMIETIKEWFKEMAERLQKGVEAFLDAAFPQVVRFKAGVTDYVGA